MAKSPILWEKQPTFSDRIRNWGKYVPDALLASLIMLIFGELGYLDWLERTTIELAAATSLAMPRINLRSAAESTAAYEDSVPRIVVITEEEFQHQFYERSPLNRARLVEILRGIGSASPMLLAIDIDLSPIAGASKPEVDAQRNLDQLLLTIAEKTRLVLVTPYPSSLDERIRENAAWMSKLCAHSNIDFAYPYIARNEGVVTKINPTFPSLGNVAYALSRRPSAASSTANQTAGGGKSGEICALLQRGEAAAPIFLDSLFAENVTRPLKNDKALVPLNVNYFEEGLAERFRFDAASPPEPALFGQAVFLGGEWNRADRFVTASGSFPGVMVHSATFFTRERPVRNLPRSLLFLIETLLGVVLLRAFTSLWEKYFSRLEAPAGTSNWRIQLAAWLRALPWAAAVLLITVLVILGSVAASGFLLAQATWFNFAPIALAAALKARETGGEVEVRKLKERIRKLEHAPKLRARWTGLVNWLVSQVFAYRWLMFFAAVALVVVTVR
jgi:fumarate reductase subunit C